jgi:hypothetical protein
VIEFRRAVADYLEHRGANALCVSAKERLDQAVGRLDALPAEPSLARRPLDEARFGFRQALERWPESPVARWGLRHCDIARVRLELALGHADAARSALDDLAQPPPELEAQVQALERELSEAEVEQVKLRKMAQEMDRWVASPLRRLLLLLWSLPVLAAMTYLLLTARDARAYSHGELLAFAAGELGLALVVVAVGRRRLLSNVFNRRIVGWFLILVTGMVFGRLVGLLARADQAGMVVAEMVLMGAVCGVGAVFLFRWFWLGTLFFWGAALVASMVPGTELMARTGAGMLTIIVATILWRPDTSTKTPGRGDDPKAPVGQTGSGEPAE